MANSTHGLVQALFQMVWADDVVTPEEVQVLTAVLRQLGFPLAEVICLLDQNLSERPRDQAPINITELFDNREDQKKALQVLMTICFSTGSIDPEQVGYIEGLVMRMGLSAQELEVLRKQAMEATC
jgi:hypothetical protein